MWGVTARVTESSMEENYPSVEFPKEHRSAQPVPASPPLPLQGTRAPPSLACLPPRQGAEQGSPGQMAAHGDDSSS